jgi:hypothetical protein
MSAPQSPPGVRVSNYSSSEPPRQYQSAPGVRVSASNYTRQPPSERTTVVVPLQTAIVNSNLPGGGAGNNNTTTVTRNNPPGNSGGNSMINTVNFDHGKGGYESTLGGRDAERQFPKPGLLVCMRLCVYVCVCVHILCVYTGTYYTS